MLQTTSLFKILSPCPRARLQTLFAFPLPVSLLRKLSTGVALSLLLLGAALADVTAAQQLDDTTSLAVATGIAPDASGDLGKNDRPELALVLPFFQVDTEDPTGVTTLFAVRNTEASPIGIDISYFATDGSLLHKDSPTLAAQATHTVNLRDVPGLVVDPDGIARGFVIVTALDGLISGDFFQVDVGESFANGERMITTSMCPAQGIRFADFGDGTHLVVLLTRPRGLDPETDPPSFTVTAVDEAGNASPPTEVYTDQQLFFAEATDFTTEPFGTLIFNFEQEDFGFGGGWVYAVYSAGGRFSVGLGPTLLPARRRCARLDPTSSAASTTPQPPADQGIEPPEKATFPESKWVLPFFRVDKTDPSGTTTLFAVRNTLTAAVDAEIRYFETHTATVVRTDTINLAAGETHTVNVRDIPGLPVDVDGFARGFVTIDAPGGKLTGDFFQVDVGGNFATGDRLLAPRTDFCAEQEARFADFGSGTELMLVLTDPRGADPSSDPISVRVTPITEDGTSLPATEIHTDQFVYFVDADDFTGEAFGTLIFDFNPEGRGGAGWVYGVYSADGLFSVGVNSTGRRTGRGCRDESDFPQDL